MGPSVQLDVDNTSPTINYFPSTDVLSNTNISRGWVPFYSQSGYASTIGEVGVGQSYHITSRVGASLIIEWHGTAIQLLGNATNISYSVTLDGQVVIDGDATRSSDILATFGNLTDSSHVVNLTITDTRSGSQLAFDKASITSPALHVSSGNITSISLNSSAIILSGGNMTETGFQLSDAGDRAAATFHGTAFLLQGIISPTSSSNYSVTLGNFTRSFSALFPFTQTDTLLYFASGLDPTIRQNVEISNNDENVLNVSLNGFQVYTVTNTSQSSSSSRFSVGGIVGLVFGVVSFIIIVVSASLYIFRRRRRSGERMEPVQTSYASRVDEKDWGSVIDIGRHTLSPLDDSPTDDRRISTRTARTGFARWKDEVENNLRLGLIGTGLVFHHSDDEKSDDIVEESNQRRSAAATPSSQRRRWRASNNRRHGSSPSFIIDLPISSSRPPSGTPEPPTPISDWTSLEYTTSTSSRRPSDAQMPPTRRLSAVRPQLHSSAPLTRKSKHQSAHSDTGPRLVPPPSPSNRCSTTGRLYGEETRHSRLEIHGTPPPSPLRQHMTASKPKGEDRPLRPLPRPPYAHPEVFSDTTPYLQVRSLSPFRVDFPVVGEGSDNSPGRQGFDQISRETVQKSQRPSRDGPRDGHFSDHSGDMGQSFLDMYTSGSSNQSEGSLMRNGNLVSRWSDTSSQGTHQRQAQPQETLHPPVSLTDPSAGQSSTSSSLFPFPVSMPSDANIRTPRRASSDGALLRIPSRARSPPTESPTGSVPYSLSELHFRNSVSETDESHRRDSVLLPRHPPLPASPTWTQDETPATPSYIVQRVLGLAHSRSTSGLTFNIHMSPATPQSFGARMSSPAHELYTNPSTSP